MWDVFWQSLGAWSTKLGPIVALIGAAASAWFAGVGFHRERLDQRLRFAEARRTYFMEIKLWASEVCLLLTEAVHLCDLDPQQTHGEPFFVRRHRLLVAISSMIDRGRWFFPNIEVDDHGADKPLGYRGYRQEVLDDLVAAYTRLNRLDYRAQANNSSLRNELTKAKRHFVGEIQRILDPAGQAEEFNTLMKLNAPRFKSKQARSQR